MEWNEMMVKRTLRRSFSTPFGQFFPKSIHLRTFRLGREGRGSRYEENEVGATDIVPTCFALKDERNDSIFRFIDVVEWSGSSSSSAVTVRLCGFHDMEGCSELYWFLCCGFSYILHMSKVNCACST
jgi:hypothetical protein